MKRPAAFPLRRYGVAVVESVACAAIELLAGGFVEVGGELGEGREFAVLRQGQTHAAAELLDDLGLGGAADAGHRDAHVDGWADTGVEQV